MTKCSWRIVNRNVMHNAYSEVSVPSYLSVLGCGGGGGGGGKKKDVVGVPSSSFDVDGNNNDSICSSFP
jgi:hypothetical protein